MTSPSSIGLEVWFTSLPSMLVSIRLGSGKKRIDGGSMSKRTQSSYLALAVIVCTLHPAMAQDAEESGSPASGAASSNSAPGDASVPEIVVIQENPVKPKSTVKKKAKTKPRPQPQQQAVTSTPVDDFDVVAEISEPARILANSPYGARGGAGAARRAQFGSLPPVEPTQALPDDIQNVASGATRIDAREISEQRPFTNHDALARVPGIITVNDDGLGRQGGIGIRGAPPRRSRKVLILEDGVPINYSTYLDASTHYTPPTERVESIEVIRGPVVSYGPLTNHGVVNFRNLSPFGADETVIKGAIGYTEGSDKSVNNFRHVHTRKTFENWGVVASYSGAEVAGAWDNEELRYNDFYGAIGVKGDNQDLKISGGYFRQRDQYDEVNFVPNNEDTALQEFFANGNNKSGSPFFFDGSRFLAGLSTFAADLYRLQATHNYYVTDSITITSRAFYSDNERNRYFVNADRGEFDETSFFMRGRERAYRFYGAETRTEFADLPLFGGMIHDIQAGVKYERHEFRNCNSVGLENQVLDADTQGRCDIFDRRAEFNGDRSRLAELEASAFSAFIQSAVHVTTTLTITPGLRFESYDIERFSIRAEEPQQDGFSASDHDVVLPMLAAAWEFLPSTTLYGGYHQGITPQITRGPAFPLPDERGDNFTIGLRSNAFKGLSFDVAYFHSTIQNYQIKSPETADGVNIFGAVDEVKIDGVELGVRADSQPITGGEWNLFGEAIYTYADGRIERGLSNDGDDISGNRIPEVPRQYANLTLGLGYKGIWDASVTWTYRGDFFTDDENSFDFEIDDGEVESGFVNDIWLLSARSNLKVSENVTLFITGTNLTNEFYLTDIDEGLKPGQSRTVMGGFVVKFD